MAEKVFVGIDVAKETLDIHVLPSNEKWQCHNNAKDIGRLVKRLGPKAPEAIILEATGGYEAMAAALLIEAELPVSIVNPRQVRDFAKAIGQLAKTDCIDALVLARYGEAIKPRLTPLPTKEERLIKEFVSRRRQLVDLRSGEKNRLHQARTDRIRQSICAVIDALDREIQQIDDDLDTTIKQSPLWQEDVKLLKTIKGIGPVTARNPSGTSPRTGEGQPPRNRQPRRCGSSQPGQREEERKAILHRRQESHTNRPLYGRQDGCEAQQDHQALFPTTGERGKTLQSCHSCLHAQVACYCKCRPQGPTTLSRNLCLTINTVATQASDHTIPNDHPYFNSREMRYCLSFLSTFFRIL